MARILVRPALLFVTALALPLLFAGCSDSSGDPIEQANGSVSEANSAIEEHNRLFGEARSSYGEARDVIESGGESTSGEGTSGEGTSGAAEQRVSQARETMQQARDSLAEAQEPLAEVQNLEVDPTVGEYTGLLSDAVDAQLTAEDSEIEFYQILEGDPSLSDNRQRANDLLSEIDQGYESARNSYAEARDLAQENPEVLSGSSQ